MTQEEKAFNHLSYLLQNAVYKGEYTATHPTVRLFWEVFHEFPLEKKKQFLCKLLIVSLRPLHDSLISMHVTAHVLLFLFSALLGSALTFQLK